MAAERFIVKESLWHIANNLREFADRLDQIACRVDGPNRDEMIVDPIKAIEITRSFASRVAVFCSAINPLEVDLFGVSPEPPPAAQVPYDTYCRTPSFKVPVIEDPPYLRLSPVEEDSRPREEPIEDEEPATLLLALTEEEKRAIHTDEPEKKKRRRV